MLRSARHSVAWMPVLKSVGCTSLQVSLRLRGAGFRRYSASTSHFHPQYNRHWFRHVIVAFSPGGIKPLPFFIWLGFPSGLIPDCYIQGAVRWMLVESCRPDWTFVEQFVTDLQSALDEDSAFLSERWMLKNWVISCLEYVVWFSESSVDYSVPIERFLDPPAVCFRPNQKDQLSKFSKYGRLFRCYDYVRSQPAPIPIELERVDHRVDYVHVRLWSRACDWFRKFESSH